MNQEELIRQLKSILEGFEGVSPGECSTLPLRLTIEALAVFIGGEVEHLASRIEAAYESLTVTAATGVAESMVAMMTAEGD